MPEVVDWLKTLGMSEYAERFAENRIDLSVLPDLTDQDLEKLGVVLGDRRKMLRAIGELSVPPPAPPQAVPLAPPAPQDTTAERRQLTVMFCDLVGSTALSARLDPEDLRAIIGAYHRCCAELVERNGGFVAKYMGDGVIAYFGYPRAHEHDAERAIRAGLALVEAVPKLKTAAAIPLQVRVGIATGLVVVGDLIGAGAAQEQAVVGETPNLAARLQGIAEPNTVVIAESTRKLLGNLFELEDLGANDLKGIAGPVRAFAALRPSAVEGRFEAFRTATTPLVGRDEEIELLMRRWAQAKAGDGSIVLIAGEPGIGKSRIAETTVERLAAEPHTRLRYFCSPHHQDSALYPSIAQLERAAGFRREDTPEQRLGKLEAVLAQGTNDLGEAVPLLADLLSIPTGDRYPPLNLTPQKRKEKTLHAQLAQVEGLSARQPVLMVFEDLHWSDPTTRESLDLLVDRIATLRVLLILTFRPEFTPPWLGRPHVTLLSLNRLPPRQRAEMIANVTGGKVLPKEIADQIIDRTDGVPLFIEELTKTVVESGIVADEGDHYALKGPVAPLAIPTTLHASLLARLDRLAPTREVAQIGAALGRSFTHELISAVAQMPQQKIDEALAQLVAAELIFRRGTPPDAEYTFKHALVQDAAYSTLLRSRRQQIHGRIATTLESQFPETMTAQPELLAHHCGEAGLSEKAVGYWLQAGQQAVARSAMTEAVAQLRRGLALLASMPDGADHEQRELEMQAALVPAVIATKGYSAPEVGEALSRATALAEQNDRTDYLLMLLYGQYAYHNTRCDFEPALLYAKRLEQIGDEQDNTAASLQGRLYQGISYYWLGDFERARELFEQCHGLGEPAIRQTLSGRTAEDCYSFMLGYLGSTLSYLGYFEQARSCVNEGVLQARRLQHAYTLGFCLLFEGYVAVLASSPYEVRRHAEEMSDIANEHGFPLWTSLAMIFNGWSSARIEKASEAVVLLTNGLTMFRATGCTLTTSFDLASLAEAYALLSQPAESLSKLDEAMRFIETTNERFYEAAIYRVRGDVLSATGDRAAAEESYHHALAVARSQTAKTLELRAATSLARLLRDQGKPTEARDALAPVYGWFTEGFNAPVLQEAKALLDELAS